MLKTKSGHLVIGEHDNYIWPLLWHCHSHKVGYIQEKKAHQFN